MHWASAVQVSPRNTTTSVGRLPLLWEENARELSEDVSRKITGSDDAEESNVRTICTEEAELREREEPTLALEVPPMQVIHGSADVRRQVLF
jgi:hypothetical protein